MELMLKLSMPAGTGHGTGSTGMKERVLKGRMLEACRFYGRDDGWSTYTVYDQDYVVSYAHTDHETWEKDHRVTVGILMKGHRVMKR